MLQSSRGGVGWVELMRSREDIRRMVSFEEPGLREISRRTFGRMGEALGLGGEDEGGRRYCIIYSLVLG